MGAAAPAPTVAAQPAMQAGATYNPLTPQGTFFKDGVEYTPQIGFGGAPAIPTSEIQQQAPQPQQGFNVNQAAAGALQGAIGGTQRAMQAPLQVGAYMNPYTSAVIDRTQQDIERQRQMAMNTLGAQATQARAFGGSRQGVAEGVLGGEYGRMGADIAAQQRQAGYTQALDAAMKDRAARAAAAGQLGQLGGQAFDISQGITSQQMQQGLMQQALQQQLIDAARQQYAGYAGSPAAALSAPLAALGVTPVPQSQTTSKQAGLFDYLTLAAQTAALCWVAREVYGQADPKWLQFREWVIGYSPDWFYNAYSKYGERFAKVVNKVPVLKAVIRPFMDSKRKSLGYK